MDDRKPWLVPETIILINAWSRAESIYALARMLGRTRSSVMVHAARLQLPPRCHPARNPPSLPWTERDETLLTSACRKALAGDPPELDIVALAASLGRSIDSLVRRIERQWGERILDRIPLETLRPKSGIDAPPGDGPLEGPSAAFDRTPFRRDQSKGAGQRRCLSCGRPFWSRGAHNRICAFCRNRSGLAAGGAP